jgi:hypothetical protein
MSLRRSQPVTLSLDGRVDAAQEPPHPVQRGNRNEFDAPVVDHRLYLVARLELEELPNWFRNNNLELWRYRQGIHTLPLSIALLLHRILIDDDGVCQEHISGHR